MEHLEFTCADGQPLCGQYWAPDGAEPEAVVVIGAATGVAARYYDRYAAYLACQGFAVVTFDYRGIGSSAPTQLRRFKARWYEWGMLDIDAVLENAHLNHPDLPLHYVGHSFGGFGVGLASASRHVDRILTVGAQHAHWRDYAAGSRLAYWWRWHLLMPAVTIARGYFPGKKLKLQDLPYGVARDWARSPRDFTSLASKTARMAMRSNQRSLTAPILAVAPSDDPFASVRAMKRALAYHPNSRSMMVRIEPEELGESELGHFALFHDRFAESFWRETVSWLRYGTWVLPGLVDVDAKGAGD